MNNYLLKIQAVLFLVLSTITFATAQQTQAGSSGNINISINVFPNPSPTQRFSVTIHSARAEKVKVLVLDAFQRLVFSKTIISDHALYVLDLSHRPRGWYYLVLVTPQGKIVKRLES